MKNSITITLPFSYKGIDHEPSALVDLDAFVKNDQTMHFIFHLVAKENSIDPYSYEYEVLESSSKIYSNPTGIAGDFLEGNSFDLDGFKEKLNELYLLNKLGAIAKDTLNIDDLDNHNKIKTALLNAYKLGTQSRIQ